MIQGYARQFTYDPRMQDRAPPFFPTTGVVQVSVATPSALASANRCISPAFLPQPQLRGCGRLFIATC